MSDFDVIILLKKGVKILDIWLIEKSTKMQERGYNWSCVAPF
jgi:hypothetical protein